MFIDNKMKVFLIYILLIANICHLVSCLECKRRVYHIHVGKTGGGTLKTMFSNCTGEIHGLVNNDMLESHDRMFLTIIRDPLARFISSYNWHHPVGGRQYFKRRTMEESIMYKCLPNITVFAEEMSSKSTKRCAQKVRTSILKHDSVLSHTSLGYGHYYDKWFNFTSTKKRVFVLKYENLTYDLNCVYEYLYGLSKAGFINGIYYSGMVAPPIVHGEYARKNQTYLSDIGRRNLLELLAQDYEYIRQIVQLSVPHEEVCPEWWTKSSNRN